MAGKLGLPMRACAKKINAYLHKGTRREREGRSPHLGIRRCDLGNFIEGSNASPADYVVEKAFVG